MTPEELDAALAEMQAAGVDEKTIAETLANMAAQQPAQQPAAAQQPAKEEEVLDKVSPWEAAAMQAGTSATLGTLPYILQAVDWLRGESEGSMSPQEVLAKTEKDQPLASMGGMVVGALPTAFGEVAALSKIPQIARMGAVGQGAARAGMSGATGALEAALRSGGSPYAALMGGLGGLAGSAVGDVAGGILKRKGAKAAEAIAAERVKSAPYQAVRKQEESVLRKQAEIDRLIGKAQDANEKQLRVINKDIAGKQKDLAAQQRDIVRLSKDLERRAPTDKQSVEYVQYQEAQKQVDRLQQSVAQKMKAVDELLATAPTTLGREREAVISAAEKGLARAEAKALTAAEKEEATAALRKMMEQEGKFRRAPEKPPEVPAPEVPSAAPARPEAPMATRADLSEREAYIIAKAMASEDGKKTMRALGEQIGMDKSTLNRRLKSYGITAENAAERVAAYEAKLAPPPPPAPTPVAKPKPEPEPEIGMFDQYPMTKGDVRAVKQREATQPVGTEFAKQRVRQAEEALAEARGAPAPDVQASRYAPEFAQRQARLAEDQAMLLEAKTVRDQLLAELNQARNPAARQQIRDAIGQAEARIEQIKVDIEDLTGQVQTGAYKRPLYAGEIAAAEKELAGNKELLAAVQADLAAWKPGKELKWATKYPKPILEFMLRQLRFAGGRAGQTPSMGVFDANQPTSR